MFPVRGDLRGRRLFLHTSQSPIRRLRLQNIIPFEACNNQVLDVSHLRILDCVAWHHVPKERSRATSLQSDL